MKRAKPLAARNPDSTADTRERILTVAERLFAARGLDAVSVRDITAAAKANLGAVNYHFGTKDKLIEAVFDRRFAPVAEQRLRALEAAEKAAGAKPPKLECVLEAIFRPAVEQAMNEKRGGVTFGKLLARSFVDPNPAIERALHRHLEPTVKRFDAALVRVLPRLTTDDVFWRMHLLMGGLHQSLLMFSRPMPNGKRLNIDSETYIKRFVAFAAASFKTSLPK